MPRRTMTIPAVASALARWMAQCRDWEDREAHYEKASGCRWNPLLLEVFFEELQKNPDSMQFVGMVRQLGREEAARDLRRRMELFHERYLSEPRGEAPSRPVLVVDNTKDASRQGKAASRGRGRESAARRPPGDAA